MKRQIIAAMSALTFLGASATVQLPAMISDNMVLQQQAQPRLWGHAAPKSTVTVITSWNDGKYTTKADAEGKWSLRVPTIAADNKPYEITITDKDGTVTVSNVLLGEVWLASGQSNMQMPLKGFDGCPVEGGYDEIATSGAYADKIRFINIPLTQSYEPQEDTEAAWSVPSAQTAQDYSATAWFYAKRLTDVLNIPIGIVNAPYGGARVESWLPREILETYEDVSLDPAEIDKMIHYHRPMLMYNAMFVPVKNYTYKGIIWYQGCSNVGAHDTFAGRLATMVEHWRKEIGDGDIPFYAVEIAPYQYSDDKDQECAAYLREAQWDAIEIIPNSAMISTNDLIKPYERYNIHPSMKRQVGGRLGDLSLNRTYGQKQFLSEGLRYKGSRAVDGEMWVSVDMPEGGGVCRNYDIQGFEVAGEDKVFYPADKVWLHWQTNEIVVSSEQVPNPVAVRYCFRDFMPGTMYGHNYLPLVPFRSDK